MLEYVATGYWVTLEADLNGKVAQLDATEVEMPCGEPFGKVDPLPPFSSPQRSEQLSLILLKNLLHPLP